MSADSFKCWPIVFGTERLLTGTGTTTSVTVDITTKISVLTSIFGKKYELETVFFKALLNY